MNGINRDLVFTTESQEDFKYDHLPTLDCKLRLIDDDKGYTSQISYTFYEKEVNTKYVTVESSAIAHQEKMQTLSKEVVRRLARIDNKRP